MDAGVVWFAPASLAADTNRMAPKSALVVRGGWDGHVPVAATELFIPSLVAHGFDVTVREDLDGYADIDALLRHDLIVQCWSMGTLTEQQSSGLRAAVRAGVGFAGWHGGVVATFTGDGAYTRMVGGEFLFHHPSFVKYRVDVVPARAEHPIVVGIESFHVQTEQYWVATDAYDDVLATTEYEPYPGGEVDRPVTMPVVWTRRWGSGRVFVSTIGHRVVDLEVPEVRTITERGLQWASRAR
jgi:type 1 glutamine amidotransferase